MVKRPTRRSVSERVGYGKPPRHRQFKPGQSGNPKGRPKGARNFATVFDDELNGRVPVTENGKHKKITKREAITKQVVNKAASGDLKAAQTVMNEARFHESAATVGDPLAIFDKPEHQLVMADIVRRIRSSDEGQSPDPESGEQTKQRKPNIGKGRTP